MFEYIKGKIAYLDNQKVIIDANNIGYKVYIPSCIYLDLLKMTEVFLYLSYMVKEDSHTLYGFLTKTQRDVFELLNTVSGIGTKTAILLLGHLDVENLHFAITNADIRIISKVPGIGRKTAERLIVELKDKFKILDKNILFTSSSSKDHSLASDAIAALMNLGYSPIQAQKAVKSILEDSKQIDLSSLITKALQKI